MKQLLRSTLIFLLVPLQLMAPLSHAHFGGELTESGVHLPGLELMLNDYDASIKHIVTTPGQHGVLVCVSNGVDQKKPAINLSSPVFNCHNGYDPHPVILFHTIKPKDSKQQYYRFLLTSSPRAPPFNTPAC